MPVESEVATNDVSPEFVGSPTGSEAADESLGLDALAKSEEAMQDESLRLAALNPGVTSMTRTTTMKHVRTH
jgi:hypothetical protein